MSNGLLILIAEAVAVYLMVLGAHSLRHRTGLGPFYALLGGITAIMSWVTDAGVQVAVDGITFMVGSTVFYTALLLGVFVLYVYDGPRSTRIGILTVAAVSALTPAVAALLHLQMQAAGAAAVGPVPVPSLRINSASVITTVADLIFLAVAWEFLGKPRLRMHTWLRAYLTLLGVMLLDVVLFNTGAFAGTPDYLSIMGGTLVSRLIVSAVAFPFLYAYLHWQNRRRGGQVENRAVLAILKEVAQVRGELARAQKEILRREKAEKALAASEANFRSLYENAPLAYQALDSDGRILHVNDAWHDLMGYPESETARHAFEDFLEPDSVDEFRRAFTELQREGGHLRMELQLKSKDGRPVDIAMHSAVRADPEWVSVRTHCILVDITKQKEILETLREEALQTERLEGLVRFCAACGKIHDDDREDASWVTPDEYLSERLPDFHASHGICPDCLADLYPDYDPEDLQPE